MAQPTASTSAAGFIWLHPQLVATSDPSTTPLPSAPASIATFSNINNKCGLVGATKVFGSYTCGNERFIILHHIPEFWYNIQSGMCVLAYKCNHNPGRQRQEDQEFKDSLDHTLNSKTAWHETVSKKQDSNIVVSRALVVDGIIQKLETERSLHEGYIIRPCLKKNL